MRDGASGRSRGFGFLTFKDPRTVNVVMVKEHYLDGKIVRPSISTLSERTPMCRTKSSQSTSSIKIDPKRAIPRDEQERTSKIFVGGVSQDANEQDFKEYFTQFGRVVDATLMIDKDTGRPRGFGFVTFDSEAAVDATLQGDLQILGKPIEVKKAQPRGNMREEEEGPSRRGGRRAGKENDRFRDNDRGTFENNNSSNTNANNQNQAQNQQGAQAMYGGGMTPQMMAQYWQKMQQYFATMQQQMATAAAVQNGGMASQMGMAGLNPAMLQQMQALQQMKQLQMQQQMARQQGSQSPLPQSPGAQAMAGMNPAMMQQMQQMHQMQMQQQQAQGAGAFGGQVQVQATPQMNNSPGGGGAGMGNFGARRGTPGYNAQDQLLFEQQKYEQQQARRAAQEAQQMQSYQQGGPTSWEGMYDDVPQPNLGNSQAGMGRGSQGSFGGQGAGASNKGGQQPNRGSQGPQSAPPANAPTGPKNAGKPGANYRGGGRGAHRGFHPYARNQ